MKSLILKSEIEKKKKNWLSCKFGDYEYKIDINS